MRKILFLHSGCSRAQNNPITLMKYLLRKTCAMATGLSLLGTPAFAATPQQIVNQSLFQMQAGAAQSSDGTFEISVSERSLVGKPAVGGSARFRLSQNVMAGAGIQNNDGSFTVERVVLPPSPETVEIQRYLNNLSLGWRYADGALFFRVSGVAPSLLEKAKEEGMDLAPYVDRWIKVDGELMDSLQELQRLNSPANLQTSELGWLVDLAKKYPPLLLTRIERRETRPNGDKIQRMRFRVNPAFMNALQRKALAEIKTTGADRRYEVQAVNAQFTEVRRVTAGMALVGVVNTTQQRLERIEIGGSITQPQKTYEWNQRLQRSIQRTTSILTIKYAMGMNLKAFTGTITPPSDFLMLSDVTKAIEDAQRSRYPVVEPLPMPEPTLEEPVSQLAPVNATDHIRGLPSAPVTVITYSDFECPFCQRFAPELTKALQEFPNDVRVVYRHFPLSFHPNAQSAAEASECAAALGGNDAFWAMHDKLFAAQNGLNRAMYLQSATAIGLDASAFASCLDTAQTRGTVLSQMESGNTAQVSGTPTTFVNGTPISGAVTYEVLKQALLNAGAKR